MSTTLVALRLNKGLSITALAEQAGVPDHVIRYAEKGGIPRPENAYRIAQVLAVSVTDIWPVNQTEAA